MGQFTQDGVIYEELPNGKVRVVGYANPANSPFADPRLAPQVQKAQNEAVASQFAPATAQADAQIKGAEAANAAIVAQANRDKAVAEARTAELNAKGGPKIDASTRAKAIQQYNYAQQLQGVIDHLNQLYTAGPGSTKGIAGIQDYLPSAANKNFDTAANAARGIVGQTLNFTGGQLNTPREAEQAIGPFLPQSSDFDSTIVQKIQSLQELANNGRENAIQTLGGAPDANGNVTPVAPQPAPQAAPEAPMTLNGGAATRAQVDPMLKALGKRIGNMLVTGAPDSRIREVLTESGVNPADTNIDQALQFRGTKDFKQWMRANPGMAYPLGPDFYTKQVPVSAARQLFNKTAATDTGGDIAAGIVAAGNAALGNRGAQIVGSINGDPEMANTGFELLRTQHPMASAAGDIAGQMLDEAALGRIPGAQGLLATRWGRRGADLAYGGVYGSGGENNGDPLTGGIEGGITNLGGGMLGRGVQGAIGRTMSGVKNNALQYLDNRGIPLTIGQIGHGSDNVVGKAVGGIEDRLAGLPGFDAVINNARRRGAQAFNQAAFKEAGGSGATGAAGLDEVGKLRDNAYSFLNNTSIPLDAQFAGSQAGVRAAIPTMPAFGNELTKSLDVLDNVAQNGALAGRDWQSALRDVRGNRASIKGQPFADQAGNALGDVEANLLDLAARQGPAGTVDSLKAANKLHGQVSTLAAALDHGPTQKADQLFTPGRLDDVSRTSARNFGGRMASLTGANRPFYELTQAGNEVLPNVVKDSGTAGRMMLVPLAASTLGGSVGAATGDDKLASGERGAEYGALLGLMAGGPYSKAGQKIIQKALLGDRPDRIVRIGDMLVRNPKYAGMFGSGLARDYILDPRLPQ